MSVIGVDFGNESCVIGMASRGGIDIILNENSNRRNPSMVSFQGKERFMGEGALSISRSNYRNTARELKRIIGRKWGEPELMADLARVGFQTSQHPETGGVGIHVSYNDEDLILTPEQVAAMMLTKLMDVAYKATNSLSYVADAVIGIPGWWTDSMRRAMLDACNIAQLKCCRLMHESTATALAYGIYKSAKGEFDRFTKDKPHVVLFIDFGHSSFSASVCTFIPGALTVKAAKYDRSLGGRDMDEVIANYLADDFLAKSKLDVRTSPKAMMKLLDAAEKAKKTLSPIGVADTVINIECLMDERDYTGRLSLEKFEELIMPLIERMTIPVEAVLEEAGFTKAQLDAVEIVGGATRVPMVKRHLATLLGADQSLVNYGLSCTMNADEAVARGAALQAAILSSRFKVKPFTIVEAVPYNIKLAWDEAPESEELPDADEEAFPDSKECLGTSTRLFQRNEASPASKNLTFRRRSPFNLTASYDAGDLPPGMSPDIATFSVKVPPQAATLPSAPKTRVTFVHDIHGILVLENAMLMELVPQVEAIPPAPEAAPADKMDVDSAGGKESEEKADGPAPAKEQPPPRSPIKVTAEAPPAPKYRPVTVTVDAATASWPKKKIDEALEVEAKMAQQDRIIRETSRVKNQLESYLYAIRDRLRGDLAPYTTDAEAADFTSKLEDMEDWLYSDEGLDSNKSTYANHLAELEKRGRPLESRMEETQGRPAAVDSLRNTIDLYKRFANSTDDATAHISEADKDKVRDTAVRGESWLNSMSAKQSPMPLNVDPCFRISDIQAQISKLHEVCKPIMSQPKPAPPAPEPAPVEEAKKVDESKESAAKADDAADVNDDAKAEEKQDKEGAVEPQGTETPMDVDSEAKSL